MKWILLAVLLHATSGQLSLDTNSWLNLENIQKSADVPKHRIPKNAKSPLLPRFAPDDDENDDEDGTDELLGIPVADKLNNQEVMENADIQTFHNEQSPLESIWPPYPTKKPKKMNIRVRKPHHKAQPLYVENVQYQYGSFQDSAPGGGQLPQFFDGQIPPPPPPAPPTPVGLFGPYPPGLMAPPRNGQPPVYKPISKSYYDQPTGVTARQEQILLAFGIGAGVSLAVHLIGACIAFLCMRRCQSPSLAASPGICGIKPISKYPEAGTGAPKTAAEKASPTAAKPSGKAGSPAQGQNAGSPAADGEEPAEEGATPEGGGEEDGE